MAVIPIALVALGFGYRLEIIIVAVACFWPLLILSRAAVRGIEPRLIEVSRALRLSPLQEAIKIIAPAALPRIFFAFRLAAGISLVVAVTVEIAVNPQGLGYEAMVAGQALRPALMLANILWIGIVGYALNAALLARPIAPVWRGGPSRSPAMSALAWRGAGLVVVVALIALWGEIAALKLVSPVFLPTPARVWMAIEHGFLHATLGAKLAGTISHMLGGWLVASIIGVALGALIGTSKAAREYIAPTLEFLRPLPASAIIPVAIAIFGLTPQMALGVIAFGSVWPALLAAIHGFAAIEPRLLEVERVLGSLAGRAS